MICKSSLLPKTRKQQLDRLTELDSDPLISYRCKNCQSCEECRASVRSKTISQLELIEQTVIEKSVRIDRVQRKVYVTLPFMKDPLPYFKDKFAKYIPFRGKGSNYGQAFKRFRAQCKKPDHIKTGIRKTFGDLLERNFVIKLSEAPELARSIIERSEVLHFYCWDAVMKDDSISTPVRMVVDPSSTGLNEILAKGENRTGNIEDILVRNRGRRHVFSTDISKMYNVLHLDSTAYPYSLMLFHNDLMPDSEPEVYLMLRAWYGVRSTGNQAMFAISKLAAEAEEQRAQAAQALEEDLYVDDLETGANSVSELDKIIEDMRYILNGGDFDNKFICKSGEKPCEKASADGEVVKLLGYNWRPEEDTFALSMSDLDFSPKKAKGASRKVFESEEQFIADIEKIQFTKRSVLSKVAAFYDPVGFFEPLKALLKIHFSNLNKLEWDQILQEEDQNLWRRIFSKFFHLSSLRVDRYFLPRTCDPSSPVRLICVADAAEHAGGAAIYAGVPMADGSFSCQLITAKSRLLSETIPRNELLSVYLMTELAFKTVQSLRVTFSDIIYVTDSTIALAWVRSSTKKLKTFVARRASAILTMIDWALTNAKLAPGIPLYHISGDLNLADRLTKVTEFDPSQVGKGSSWNEGLPWMRKPTDQLLSGLNSFEKVQVPKDQEEEYDKACMDQPHLLDIDCLQSSDIVAVGVPPLSGKCDKIPVGKELAYCPVDLVFFGWKKSLRILARVLYFIRKIRHLSSNCPEKCMFCKLSALPLSSCENLAEKFIFRQETYQILKEQPQTSLKKFRLEDGILYHDGRVNEDHPFDLRDVEYDVMFDTQDLLTSTYVVRPKSKVFQAYLAHTHLHLVPHSGNLRTERILMQKLFPIGRFKHIIAKVRDDCTACRIISKKTVQVKMSQFPAEKTQITPPFYNVQMDVVFGFNGRPFTKARTRCKLYALVIVCINTSATSILCIEAISTEEIMNAILRHSARYGLPANVFVDNGSQLIALEHAKFSIRDVDLQLWDAKGVRVLVTRPKAHADNGKCEIRVRLLREMLKKANLAQCPALTQLQFETAFAMIANDLNNIPLCRTDSSNVSSKLFEIITPNRLLLGRNNFRSLYLDVKLDDTTLPSQILSNNSKIFSFYWQTLVNHFHYFTGRQAKWTNQDSRQLKTGDIVSFLFDDNKVSPTWRLGRVVHSDPTRVTLDYRNVTKNSDTSSKFCTRSPRDCILITSESECAVLSNKYFRSLLENTILLQDSVSGESFTNGDKISQASKSSHSN